MREKKVKGVTDVTPRMEDYLEVVALLKKEKTVARVKDISVLMNVKTPTVTAALNALSLRGLVVHERYGYVDLTPKGKRLAEGIQKRHDLFVKFLTDILGINARVAKQDACKMEHTVSSETFEKLAEFVVQHASLTRC